MPIADPVLDAGTDVLGAPDVTPQSALLFIDVSPLALSPKFSPSVFDYVVRCAAGANPVTITVVDTTGSTTFQTTLAEDQDYVVRGAYSIRCLPHDFPPIEVSGNGTPTSGFFLLSSPTYAMVLDERGTPVWYARGTNVLDVDSLAPNHVSFFTSAKFELHWLDLGVVVPVIATADVTDGHEIRRLADGSHLLFTYPSLAHVDLTGLGTFGADETIVDCEIQQLAPNGILAWSWRASDHVDPVTETLEPTITATGGVDVFHCNSIDLGPNGDMLVSMRETNAIYDVDRTTGQILWKLGGTPANKDGAAWISVVGDPQGTFDMQHDARFAPNGHITLYDDHGAGTTGVARGVDYYVDLAKKTATFSWQYLGTGQSKFEGSFRRYADGESVIGWGFVPKDARALTEVDAQGHDVFDVSLGGVTSYRAIKVPRSQLDISLLRSTAGK